MASFFKAVVLLVTLAVSAASLHARLLPFQAPPMERPIGCHEHGGKVPSPSPTSYQCCLTGHNTAVLQSPHATKPFVHSVPGEVVGESVVSFLVVSDGEVLTVSSGSPPCSSPLRI